MIAIHLATTAPMKIRRRLRMNIRHEKSATGPEDPVCEIDERTGILNIAEDKVAEHQIRRITRELRAGDVSTNEGSRIAQFSSGAA